MIPMRFHSDVLISAYNFFTMKHYWVVVYIQYIHIKKIVQMQK